MKSCFIKSQTDEVAIVAGYGVVFGGSDLEGEFFTPDTDFDLEWIPNKKVLYDHTISGSVKGILGGVPADNIKQDEIGLFFETEINKSHQYSAAVLSLVEAGALGFSTGTVPQLMERKSTGEITKWPIAEISLTATPAEPRTLGIAEIKKLAEHVKELEKWSAEAGAEGEAGKAKQGEGADPFDNSGTEDDSTKTGEGKMEAPNVNTGAGTPDSREEAFAEMAARLAALETQLTDISDQGNQGDEGGDAGKDVTVDSLNEKIENMLKHVEGLGTKAGFVTGDGGTKDEGIKNFADFLVSVKRQDSERLAKVYGSTKDLGGDDGPSGGWLIPSEYESTLLQMSALSNPITQAVKTIPVSRPSGSWPALDQYLVPGAGTGETAMSAGVTAAITPAGETLTETDPSFSMLNWRLHKLGGYTEVDNELMEDSPFAIEALLTGLFSVAIGAKNERNILRGNGVGEPMGILNSPSAVGVTPATNNLFSWPDVATMHSRFKSAGQSPVWVIHPGVWPDIMQMEIGSAGAAAWTANMQGTGGSNINGYPIITSEHAPQADNSGCVLLADLSAYLLFVRSGINVAFSEHAGFLKEQGTWRFSQRVDGKPWLKNAITLADPQGSYTVSPFIYLND